MKELGHLVLLDRFSIIRPTSHDRFVGEGRSVSNLRNEVVEEVVAMRLWRYRQEAGRSLNETA